MAIADLLTIALSIGGVLFIIAGTAGLLRFPDSYSRLHALAKADNLGLGLIAAATALQASSVTLVLKIVLVWLVALVSSAVTGHLIARRTLHTERTHTESPT